MNVYSSRTVYRHRHAALHEDIIMIPNQPLFSLDFSNYRKTVTVLLKKESKFMMLKRDFFKAHSKMKNLNSVFRIVRVKANELS